MGTVYTFKAGYCLNRRAKQKRVVGHAQNEQIKIYPTHV